ncbi:MAG: hypothetical protein COA79_26640 [Planctomycetota bacterium]|nr:MAG: hypothetical protein COA79_26640 [Planctomycetota bacterium]
MLIIALVIALNIVGVDQTQFTLELDGRTLIFIKQKDGFWLNEHEGKKLRVNIKGKYLLIGDKGSELKNKISDVFFKKDFNILDFKYEMDNETLFIKTKKKGLISEILIKSNKIKKTTKIKIKFANKEKILKE